MLDPSQLVVSQASERLSPREQIAQILQRAREKNEPLRIRLPFTLYEYDDGRTYTTIRDSTWNLQLPATVSVETVETLIDALGRCIYALALAGSQEVLTRLDDLRPSLGEGGEKLG